MRGAGFFKRRPCVSLRPSRRYTTCAFENGGLPNRVPLALLIAHRRNDERFDMPSDYVIGHLFLHGFDASMPFQATKSAEHGSRTHGCAAIKNLTLYEILGVKAMPPFEGFGSAPRAERCTSVSGRSPCRTSGRSCSPSPSSVLVLRARVTIVQGAVNVPGRQASPRGWKGSPPLGPYGSGPPRVAAMAELQTKRETGEAQTLSTGWRQLDEPNCCALR